jgi:hypothetical protein
VKRMASSKNDPTTPRRTARRAVAERLEGALEEPHGGAKEPRATLSLWQAKR